MVKGNIWHYDEGVDFSEFPGKKLETPRVAEKTGTSRGVEKAPLDRERFTEPIEHILMVTHLIFLPGTFNKWTFTFYRQNFQTESFLKGDKISWF